MPSTYSLQSRGGAEPSRETPDNSLGISIKIGGSSTHRALNAYDSREDPRVQEMELHQNQDPWARILDHLR